MPRLARLDTLDFVHHIMIRGIERSEKGEECQFVKRLKRNGVNTLIYSP